jgi:hypothetical protein
MKRFMKPAPDRLFLSEADLLPIDNVMPSQSPSATLDSAQIPSVVRDIVFETPVLDIHTHLYPPSFRQLCLWGIDELVNYHYLVAETFRSAPVKPAQFWGLSKPAQADLIWDTLFVKHTPISEACRGVVKVISEFGLNPNAPDLKEARAYFSARNVDDYIADVLRRANVTEVVMTNDIFDRTEAAIWKENPPRHPRFHAVLRMDPLLNNWQAAHEVISSDGFATDAVIDSPTLVSARKFLDSWIQRLKPLYLAASLPPAFAYPEESQRGRLLNEVVLPACRAHNIPFSMMIGARKQVNPALRDAGDSLGHATTAAVERICLDHPDNKFLVSMLSRENQHELCVAARKFSNLMPFGCWWFLNNPSIVPEITDERLELLGTSFIPQHSDARILDQLVYKWNHSRHWISESLARAYSALVRDGWRLTTEQVRRDVERMFQDNFRQFAGLPAFERKHSEAAQ